MRIVFMGTPEFAVASSAAVFEHHELAAVFTRPDRRRGRGRKLSPAPVKEWAVARGVPVEQPATLRAPETQQALAAYEPEAIVVAAYGLILPPAVLQIPARGCINVHASLLPRHRGAAPVAWSILAGDEVTGVTTMLMDEGMDTGPTLLQRNEPIRADDTTATLTKRLAALGAELLVETLRRWAEGTLEPSPQDDSRATMAPRLLKQDGAIDWAAPADAIDRQVRAMQPWPVAYTDHGDERLRIWRVARVGGGADGGPAAVAGADERPVSSSGSETDVPEPGTIVISGPEGLRVACGDGELIEIVDLQRPGGRRMSAAELLRGHDLPAGGRFRRSGD